MSCVGSKNCTAQPEWMRIAVYAKDIPPRPICDQCRRKSAGLQRIFSGAGKDDILNEISQSSTVEEFIEYAKSLVWDYRFDQIEKDDLEYIFSLKSDAFNGVLINEKFIDKNLNLIVDLDPEEKTVRTLRRKGLIRE